MEKTPSCSLHKDEGCLLYINEACHGNTGHAAIGAVIKAHLNDKLSVVWRAGRSIGKKTKDEAGLEALLFGLERTQKSQYKHVTAVSDSEVLVKQYHEQHEVKSPELRSLLQRIKEVAKKLCGFSLRYDPHGMS